MALIDRVKNICLSPSAEWPVIAEEKTPTGTLLSGYVAPLAAVGAVAGFIGGSIVGLPFIGRTPVATGVVVAVFTFVMAIVSCLIVSMVINVLAPTFGGQQNFSQALKLAVYSYTPGWVAGVLHIVPGLGILAILAAFYGLYLLYLGIPRLMKCPPDKAVGYTVVVVVCTIVLTMVVGTVGGVIAGAGMLTSGAMTSAARRAAGRPAVEQARYDPNSALGKLQALGDKLDESNKKMEAAQKSGDANAQAAAALDAFGTLLGGGKHVDPLDIEALKPFVPETFAGLAKKTSNAEKNGIANLMVSKAEATYGDDAGKRVSLTISDTGGASGLVGLASWVGVQEDKENEYAIERTRKVDGRLVHERIAKKGRDNEFGLVLGDRFVVSASGRGVTIDQLKTAVASIDLGKLEGLKNVGVK